MKPISPSEVRFKLEKAFPPEVIAAFNECICENMRRGSARVLQDDVLNRICAKLSVERKFVYERNWLDVEDLYGRHGWEVTYDKPGYNESYAPYFVFKEFYEHASHQPSEPTVPR